MLRDASVSSFADMAIDRPNRPRMLASILAATALAACTIRPTPSLIADCHSSAVAESRPGPKAASLFIDAPSIPRPCPACANLLRDWRFDFVEISSPDGGGLVDRLRLLPRESPDCAPADGPGRQLRPPRPFYLSVPRRACLAVERGRQPQAAIRLSVTSERVGDHWMELYEAGPRTGGPVRGRVRDFTIRSPDARAAQCARVLRGFPGDAMAYVLDQIAERR